MNTEGEGHIWTKQHKIKENTRKKIKCHATDDKNACFPDAAFLFSHRCTHQSCVCLRTFTRTGNLALNKVDSCMISPSFKIKVACASVSIHTKNFPELSASA